MRLSGRKSQVFFDQTNAIDVELEALFQSVKASSNKSSGISEQTTPAAGRNSPTADRATRVIVASAAGPVAREAAIRPCEAFSDACMTGLMAPVFLEARELCISLDARSALQRRQGG